MAIDHFKIVNKTAADVIINYINTSSDGNVPQDPEPLRPIITSGTCIKFNQSDPFHIGDKYGGIPLNLLTNTIGWATLLVRGWLSLELLKSVFLF